MARIGLGIGIQYSRVTGNPLVSAFQARVIDDGGTFEAVDCLNAQIALLQSLGLYDLANQITTSNAYKASKIYSLKPVNGSGDVTLARASNGSRNNSSKLWETMSSNVPRLNYPSSGCPKWLFEPQTTNIIPNSNDLTGYILGDVTIATNNDSSPFSGDNADKIVENSANSTHFIRAAVASTNNAYYSYQTYIKPSGRSQVFIEIISGSLDIYGYINLTTGAVTGNNFPISATILANGYCLIKFENFQALSTLANVYTYLAESGSITYLGNGSNGVECIGNQLEVSPLSTSPIITTGAAGTRIKDVAYIPCTATTAFTIFTTVEVLETISATRYISDWQNGSGRQGLLYKNSSNKVAFNPFLNDVGLTAITSIADMEAGENKIAISFDGTTYKLYLNGASPVISTQVGGVPNALYFGPVFSDANSSNLFGMQCVFNSVISEANCRSLTTL